MPDARNHTCTATDVLGVLDPRGQSAVYSVTQADLLGIADAVSVTGGMMRAIPITLPSIDLMAFVRAYARGPPCGEVSR